MITTLSEYAEYLDENRQKRLDLVEQLFTNQIDVKRYRIEMLALADREAKTIALKLGKTVSLSEIF